MHTYTVLGQHHQIILIFVQLYDVLRRYSAMCWSLICNCYLSWLHMFTHSFIGNI